MSTPAFKRNRLRQAVAMSAVLSVPFIGAYSRSTYAACTGEAGTYLCEGVVTALDGELEGAPLEVTTSAPIEATEGLILYGEGGVSFQDVHAGGGAGSQIDGLDISNSSGDVEIDTDATISSGIWVENQTSVDDVRDSISISSAGEVSSSGSAIFALNEGQGDLIISVSGTLNSNYGMAAYNAGDDLTYSALNERSLIIDLSADLISNFDGIHANAKVGSIDISTVAGTLITAGGVGIDVHGYENTDSIVLDLSGDIQSIGNSVELLSESTSLENSISVGVFGNLTSEEGSGIDATVEAGSIAISTAAGSLIDAGGFGIGVNGGQYSDSIALDLSGDIISAYSGVYVESDSTSDGNAISINVFGNLTSEYGFGIEAAAKMGNIDISTAGDTLIEAGQMGVLAFTYGEENAGDLALSLDGDINADQFGVVARRKIGGGDDLGTVRIDLGGSINASYGVAAGNKLGDLDISQSSDGGIFATELGIYAFSNEGSVDLDIAGQVESGGTGVWVESYYGSEISIDVSGSIASEGSFEGQTGALSIGTHEQDGSIEITVAEGGSVESAMDGIAINSYNRVGGDIAITVAGEVAAGESYSAIRVDSYSDPEFEGGGGHLTLELQSGWALNGDVVLAGVPSATLVLGGTLASSLDLSRLSSTDAPDGSRLLGFTDFAKTGTSTFTLSGNGSNFDGFNSAAISGGTLVLENATFTMSGSAGALTVGPQATLSFNNSTVAGSVNNSGVVAVTAGTATITGDFDQGAAGTLRIDIAGDGTHGTLVVDGNARFADGAAISVNMASPGDITTIAGGVDVVSAGHLESNGFTVTDNSILLDFAAEVDASGNQVNLQADSQLGSIVAGQSDSTVLPITSVIDQLLNEYLATGDAGSFAAAINSFASLESEQEVINAVSQLVPMLSGNSPQVVSQLMFALDRILGQQGGVTGAASGDSLLSDGHLWLKPFGSWAEQDRHEGVSGFDADSVGLVFGADADLDGGRSLGAALVYASTSVDSTSTFAPQGSEVDSYLLRMHGAQTLGPDTVLNVQADLGFHNTEGERAIAFGDVNYVASSDYSSNSFHLGAGINHRLWAGDGMDFQIGASADYNSVKDEGYREKGADALSLQVSEDRSEELLLAVDGKLSYLWGELTSVSANLGVAYDVIDDDDGVTAAFAGAPGLSFRTPGLDQDPLLIRAGLGLQRDVSEGFQMSVRYDLETREDFSNQTASFNMNWSF